MEREKGERNEGGGGGGGEKRDGARWEINAQVFFALAALEILIGRKLNTPTVKILSI